MILPTKHVSVHYSLLGAGAVLLSQLESPKTVSALWEQVRTARELRNYSRFILALDFLFIIGVLNLADGLVVRSRR